MANQDELIGPHPIAPNIFHKWFTGTDHPLRNGICHRALESNLHTNDPETVDWLAHKIIEHHYSPAQINRLKDLYGNLGFPKYAAQFRQLPLNEITRKGNATEIILVEYIDNCNPESLVRAYRLRFNPNVDQSMKGDDALLVEVTQDEYGNDDLRVFLGEAKFRSTPSNAVLNDIRDSLAADKLPLSYSFLVQRLWETPETVETAKLLEKFVIDEIKAKGKLNYAGLLLSTVNAGTFVENNFSSTNPKLVIISAGVDSPSDLVANAFHRAEEILAKPIGI